MIRMILLFVCLHSALLLFAQPKVDSNNLHERVIAIVPLTGAGTYADPKRPLFTPRPGENAPDIVSFRYELTDDSKFAILELTARNSRGLQPLLGANSPDIKVFRKGKDKKDDIERELKKVKKDIDLTSFVGGGR